MSKYVSKKIANVPVSSIRVIFDKARRMTDVVRMEIGEPDVDTPRNIKEAATQALDEGYTHYTPFNGFSDLRQEISRKVKSDNGLQADPEKEIIVTPGACSAVYCSLLSIINPEEEVLVPDPGWPHYEVCVKMAGGVPIHYPQLEKNDFSADPNDIGARITPKTKAIVINSPNNPTGSVLSRKILDDISDIAMKNDLIVVSDEVYEKIIYDGHKNVSIGSLPGMKDRTITINGFSKTYAMTGWRLGYAVAPAEIVDQMSKLVLYTATCANSMGQKAAIQALKGKQNFVSEMAEEYKRKRDFVVKRLNEMKGISCKLPKGAFYVFPNIKGLKMSSFECASYFLEESRVSTVPGAGFGEYGEGYLRLSYANSIENLEKGMSRMEQALKNRLDTS